MTSSTKARVRQQLAAVRRDLADLEKMLAEDEPEAEPTPALQAAGGPALMALPAAAESLGIGTTKLKLLVAAGEIKSVRIGQRRLFSPQHIQEFIESAEQEPERRPRRRARGGRR